MPHSYKTAPDCKQETGLVQPSVSLESEVRIKTGPICVVQDVADLSWNNGWPQGMFPEAIAGCRETRLRN